MPANHTYDYAIVRVVPRVERGEFVNAGVIVACAPQRYLKAMVHIYEEKILALDPKADLKAIRATVEAIPLICEGGPQAGDLGKLSKSERFHWLIAPRSSAVQTSPSHAGRCVDLDAALKEIFEKMV